MNKIMRLLISSIAVAGLVMASVPAFAYSYTLDEFIDSVNLKKSSDAAEQQALADLLEVEFDDLSLLKIEAGLTVLLDGPDHYYIDIAPSTTDYFILKFGVGNTGKDDHYFFENIGEMTKLVWDNEQVNGLQNGIGSGTKLSHYSLVNSTVPRTTSTPTPNPASIPEPATLGLAALALLGLAAMRRRAV